MTRALLITIVLGGLAACTTGSSHGPAHGGARMSLAARVCPPGPYGEPLPPEGQRSATLVRAGFDFVEGPLWLADQGVLLFSDMNMSGSAGKGPPSRIHRLKPPSSFDIFAQDGNSNGLALDLDGNVLACTHDAQTLSRYHPVTAARTTLSSLTYQDKRFYSPNDLTVRSDGTVYFTDPDWQSDGRDGGIGQTNVYRVTPSGAALLVTDALDKPNGIALSPDEATLYVGSIGSDILSFAVRADGSVTPNGVFASAGGGTDGFTVDCAGNLYATGGNRVQVWNVAGAKLGEITVPRGTTNVAFGGADRKTLYITARDGLYSIQLLVPGLPY
jgi:gluconolactonase